MRSLPHEGALFSTIATRTRRTLGCRQARACVVEWHKRSGMRLMQRLARLVPITLCAALLIPFGPVHGQQSGAPLEQLLQGLSPEQVGAISQQLRGTGGTQGAQGALLSRPTPENDAQQSLAIAHRVGPGQDIVVTDLLADTCQAAIEEMDQGIGPVESCGKSLPASGSSENTAS